MQRSESDSAKKAEIEAKPIKDVVKPTASVGLTATVESALDELQAQAADTAPVTDQKGILVGNVSKNQMNREVGGRGHDPKTTPMEPEVEKEGAPFCFENQTIAEAEKMMREGDVKELSVVNDEKRLLGKATLEAIEQEKKKTNG